MKIVIAPDSFKGSLSAVEAAAAMAAGARDAQPEAETVELPVGDGGEGTVEAMVRATGGRMAPVRVTGPLGEPVEALSSNVALPRPPAMTWVGASAARTTRPGPGSAWGASRRSRAGRVEFMRSGYHAPKLTTRVRRALVPPCQDESAP